MKFLHITPFLWLLCLPVMGQVNLKAGYCLSRLDAPGYNSILEAHNTSIPGTYTDPFKALKILHGMDIGLEYRWESFAIEAGWRTKRNRLQSVGSNAQVDFRNSLTASINSFYTGLVQYYGPIRITASIDYTYVVSKIDFENPALLTTLKDYGWGSNFSLGYMFRGAGPVSLVIAPYAQIQWDDYDLAPLRDVLTESSFESINEDYFNFGITLYFLNGPH